MGALDLALLAAAAMAAALLGAQALKVRAFGGRTLFSEATGDPRRGALYAFTKGMLPWAKESVRENLLSFSAGMAFHGGVFAGFALVGLGLSGLGIPAVLLHALRGLTLAGGLAGLGLLVKRAACPALRGLSNPDDYLSNLLSSGFALLAFAAAFGPAWTTACKVAALLLLAYMPLGKIRHCVFFFTTRYHLGAFFGRRGTFPPSGSHHA